MVSPTNEFLNPTSLVLPNMTTAEKEALIVEVGTVVYDTDLSKISFCKTARTTGGAAWDEVTSS